MIYLEICNYIQKREYWLDYITETVSYNILDLRQHIVLNASIFVRKRIGSVQARDTYGNFLGRWDLKEMPVTDGRIGLKVGVDFNSENSPCTSNPFTNSSVISSIYSPQSYSLSQSGDNPDITYITDTTQYVENSSYTLKFNYNISTTLYKKLYAYMYDTTKVGTTDDGVPYGNYLIA